MPHVSTRHGGAHRGEVGAGPSAAGSAHDPSASEGVESDLDAYLRLDRVIATAQAAQLELVERMHRVYLTHLSTAASPGVGDPSRRGQDDAAWAADGVAAELEVATGHGSLRMRALVEYALSGSRSRVTRRALAAGECTLQRAMEVQEHVADLETGTANAVAEAALRRRPDGFPPGRAQLRRWIRAARVAAGVDEDAVRARRIAERTVTARTLPDGGGQLCVDGSEVRIQAAAGRIDALARRARRDGDIRTLGQLRSDIALDLLMFGRFDVMTGAVTKAGALVHTTGSETGRGDVEADGDARARAGAHVGAGAAPLMDWPSLGEPPPAVVHVTAGLATLMHAAGLLGSGDPPGSAELDGHGPVPPTALAEVALREGSTWARIVIDDVSGDVLGASTPRYAPTPLMRRAVVARDRTCQFPGCAHEARSCDLDHVVAWRREGPADQTRVDNLMALHRRHHNLKTRGLWSGRRARDGSGAVEWTSLLGGRYRVEREQAPA